VELRRRERKWWGFVNCVLGSFCVKVFQATNRRGPWRGDAGAKPPASVKKEEERNVEETDGEGAEWGRAGPGRVRVDHRAGVHRMHHRVELARGDGFRRVQHDLGIVDITRGTDPRSRFAGSGAFQLWATRGGPYDHVTMETSGRGRAIPRGIRYDCIPDRVGRPGIAGTVRWRGKHHVLDDRHQLLAGEVIGRARCWGASRKCSMMGHREALNA